MTYSERMRKKELMPAYKELRAGEVKCHYWDRDMYRVVAGNRVYGPLPLPGTLPDRTSPPVSVTATTPEAAPPR